MNTLVNVPKNGNLVNRNSRRNLPDLPTWIDEMFNRDLPSLFSANFNSGLSLPKVNIKETAEDYWVEMAVPGFKKSDFKIDLDNQTLTIQTHSTEEHEENNENYLRREFGYSAFQRSFSLPESVDGEKIKATYNDGILRLHLPKKEEAKKKPAQTIKIS